MPAGRGRVGQGGRRAHIALLLLVLFGSVISAGTDLVASAVSAPNLAASVSDENSTDGDPEAGVPANPEGYGTVLATNPIAVWAGLDGVEQVVYRTRGPVDATTTGTALVRRPTGTPPPGGWPVVALTHGTSGMGQDCGLLGPTGLAAGEAPTVARFNEAGYAVVVPDYLGLNPQSPGPHPYLDRATEATATIDAVRAAHTQFSDISTTWAVVGYSQGGHAALAAGNLAPTYAPDLDLRGIVALAPTSNVESIYARAAPQMPDLPFFPYRNFAAVLNSLRTTHPSLDVNSYLSPVGRELVDQVAGACYAAWPDIIGTRSPGELLAKPLDTPEFVAALKEHLAVPTSGYSDPILIVHGSRDQTVPLSLSEELIGELSAAGTPYEFKVLNAQHADLGVSGGSDLAAEFVARVMPASGA